MEVDNIKHLLRGIVHPETEKNIVDSGVVKHIGVSEGAVAIVLDFGKRNDPFSRKIEARIRAAIAAAHPAVQVDITVDSQHDNKAAETSRGASVDAAPTSSAAENRVSDAAEVRRAAAERVNEQIRSASATKDIARIVAVASGKGGVGKSTVTSNLAVALARKGYDVGILDADIYGPSQTKMFGVEQYVPAVESIDGTDYIIPARTTRYTSPEGRGSISVMSIAMFISPDDALMWRGAMANSALRQLIHQTKWGRLDFLLIDLPPGTGDIHLSIISELHVDGAVVVSTPQQVAVADAVRGVAMFRHPNVGIPVLGIIENMAWFTPAELPDHRYYIFGRGGAARYAAEAGVELIGEIPIIQSIMDGGEAGVPAAATDAQTAAAYGAAAEKIVEKLAEKR